MTGKLCQPLCLHMLCIYAARLLLGVPHSFVAGTQQVVLLSWRVLGTFVSAQSERFAGLHNSLRRCHVLSLWIFSSLAHLLNQCAVLLTYVECGCPFTMIPGQLGSCWSKSWLSCCW